MKYYHYFIYATGFEETSFIGRDGQHGVNNAEQYHSKDVLHITSKGSDENTVSFKVLDSGYECQSLVMIIKELWTDRKLSSY